MKTTTLALLLVLTATCVHAAEPCQVRLILFTPSDVAVPDGYQERINQVVAYTESFYEHGLKRWGHKDFVMPFRRTESGDAEVLVVKGANPKETYKNATVRNEAIATAKDLYQLEDVGRQVWWVMVYVGDPPAKFRVFQGASAPKTGGWSVCNYDSRPGRIDPDDPLGDELLAAMNLKAVIHELGHGFQLPHIGPRLGDDAGNSLMGPTHAGFRKNVKKRDDRIYLSEAAAALLSIHPAFHGIVDERDLTPTPVVEDVDYSSSAGQKQMTVSGRVKCDVPAKFALVADMSDAQPGEYWTKTYVGEVAADGAFEVTVTEPAAANGKLILWFAFENGVHTGNGKQRGRRSGIERAYKFQGGRYRF